MVRYPGVQFDAMTQLSSGKLDCILCRWDMPEFMGTKFITLMLADKIPIITFLAILL